MSTLGQPSAAYSGDRGEPDLTVRALVAAAGESREAYLRAIVGLCTSRFLLPIVTVGEDGGEGPDPERHAELRSIQLASPDGTTGLPVFTGLDALISWRPDARPVPCRLDEVAATAAEQGSAAILIDVAGPHPLVIESGLIAELARGRRLVEFDDGGWGWLYAGPDSSEAARSG